MENNINNPNPEQPRSSEEWTEFFRQLEERHSENDQYRVIEPKDLDAIRKPRQRAPSQNRYTALARHRETLERDEQQSIQPDRLAARKGKTPEELAELDEQYKKGVKAARQILNRSRTDKEK